MVWGSTAARRHERAPDPDSAAIGLDERSAGAARPAPVTAECARCEASVVLAGVGLPRGWVIVDGGVICADCDQATSRRYAPVDPAVVRDILRRRAAQPIGALLSAGPHHGCRVAHDILCGFAALEFRAGAAAPAGRDEAVCFMLDAAGLDQLVIHLSTVRAELVASRTSREPIDG